MWRMESVERLASKLLMEGVVGEWIEHDGKGMPIDPEQRAMVKFRDGNIDDVNPAKAKFWSSGRHDWWAHEGDRDSNIIAYCVVNP